jgi:hypothetical protein
MVIIFPHGFQIEPLPVNRRGVVPTPIGELSY